MNEPTHIKPDQSIILGNHVACDGKASKEDGQSFLVVSHYHGDHYKHPKINDTFTDKIPLIVSQGTWNILERLARVNIRNNADVMAQKFNEEKEYVTLNGKKIKITLKDSKHMLGASQIQVEEENGHRYGYSGDFNSDLDEFIDVDTLVLDATNGQNALSQAKEFDNVATLTGIVLTKLDGTAKGGIVVALRKEMDLPVKLIGVGEGVDDLQTFDGKAFSRSLFMGQ